MRRLVVVLAFLFLSVRALAQPPEPLLTFGRGEIVSAAWAPDGQSVWIGTTAGTWQFDANLQEIAAYPHITYAALSPDGTKLAGAALETGTIGVWSAESGMAVLAPGDVRPAGVTNVGAFVWSPNSELFSFSTPTNSIIVDVDRQWVRYVNDIPSTHLEWSASGRYIAGFVAGHEVWAFDWDTQSEVPLQKSVRNVDLGTTYLLWRGDEELLWNTIGDGSDQSRWIVPEGRLQPERWGLCSYTGCAFSPDSQLVATTGTVGLRIKDAISDRDVFQLEGDYFWSPTWSPSGTSLAVVRFNWNRATEHGIAVYDFEHDLFTWDQTEIGYRTEFLSWTTDATRLLTVGTGRIAVLDAQTGGILSRSEAFRMPDVLALDTSGERVASSDTFGDVTTLSVDTGLTIDTVIGTSLPVGFLRWQPDGDMLAALSFAPLSKTHLYLRDPNTLDGSFGDLTVNTVHVFDDQRIDPIREFVAWSPDGGTFAVTSADHVYLHGIVNDVLELPRNGHYPSSRVTISEIEWIHGTKPVVAYTVCCDSGGIGHLVELSTGLVAYQKQWRPWRLAPAGYFVILTPLFQTYVGPLMGFDLRHIEEDTLPWGTVVPLPGMSVDMTTGWISPFATYVAVVDADGDGLVWDSAGAPVSFLAGAHDLVWSPDEATLAILRRDGSVWLQDADGLRVLWSPPVPVRSPGMVVWSGDSATVALVQDGVARVWRP